MELKLFQIFLLIPGIAHHLAGLPGHPAEWGLLGARHPYHHGPFMPHPHPHFPHHIFGSLDRPLNSPPRLTNGKFDKFVCM